MVKVPKKIKNGIIKKDNTEVCFISETSGEMFDPALTRSTTVGILMTCPQDDLAPLMAWIAERRREKAKLQRSQQNVLL